MPCAVYPRGCGATGRSEYLPEHKAGLSPRVRGNRLEIALNRDGTGSIPAGAGQPSTTGTSSPMSRVYPRGCGATADAPGATEGDLGLSPRVRGNRAGDGSLGVCRRSIPAGAGQPDWDAYTDYQGEVYPRGCGATRGTWSHLLWRGGLSPRVRGNQRVVSAAPVVARSIPAGAGQPGTARTSARKVEVYPRGCGATSTSDFSHHRNQGLSPRVRGNRAKAR